MRNARHVTFVVLGMVMAAPATAQQSPESIRAIAATGQPAADQKIVCKKDAKLGTRMVNRTCKTVQEWRTIREQHMRDASAMINTPTICTGTNEGDPEGC